MIDLEEGYRRLLLKQLAELQRTYNRERERHMPKQTYECKCSECGQKLPRLATQPTQHALAEAAERAIDTAREHVIAAAKAARLPQYLAAEWAGLAGSWFSVNASKSSSMRIDTLARLLCACGYELELVVKPSDGAKKATRNGGRHE